MSQCSETSHDATEAMVERHRQTDTIIGRVSKLLAGEEAVVQNIVMRQRRDLWPARRAGSVLDVDRIVALQRILTFAQLRLGNASSLLDETVPRHRGPRSLVAEIYHSIKVRQLGRQLVDHGGIVGVPKSPGRNNDGNTGLRQNGVQLTKPVSGIDVDHDLANLRERVLYDQPLRTIWSPKTDPVTLLYDDRDHSSGDLLNF